MADFSRKIHYLRGLAGGMLPAGNPEQLTDLIVKLLDAMGDAADAIDELYEMQDELNDYVESIDDDLFKLENGFDENTELGGEGYPDAVREKAQLHPFPGKTREKEADFLVMNCPDCLRPYRVRAEDFLMQACGKCPHCGSMITAQDVIDEDELPYLKIPEEDGE